MTVTTEQILAALDAATESAPTVLPLEEGLYPRAAVESAITAFPSQCRCSRWVDGVTRLEISLPRLAAGDRRRILADVLDHLLIESLRCFETLTADPDSEARAE